MALVLVCEIIEEDNTLVHECFDFTETYNTKMIDRNSGANESVGEFYDVGPRASIQLTSFQPNNILQNGTKPHHPTFKVELINGVVHIKTTVFCFKKSALEEKSFGNRPFSPQIGAVRDPQGRLKKSFNDGRQHTVIVRYAPVPGETEAFEIVDVFEFVNGKERLPPPENRNDEDDKENDKKKKPASKGKAGKAARRRAQRIP